MVNAYLLPAMRGYLSKLAERLAAIGVTAPVQVMAFNGGMIGIDTARDRPVFAADSGPAGGVAGAARLGPVIGASDLIVFDMGGTTAKAAIVEGGEPQIVTEYEFRDGMSMPSRVVKGAGYMLKVPAIDIAEVGSGGGSIARVDAGGSAPFRLHRVIASGMAPRCWALVLACATISPFASQIAAE